MFINLGNQGIDALGRRIKENIDDMGHFINPIFLNDHFNTVIGESVIGIYRQGRVE
jgi:hypothetical protein